MNIKKLLNLFVCVCCVCGCSRPVPSACDRVHYPPTFGDDTLGIRQDKLTRAYITPRRIVWTSGSDAVVNPELLLRPNTGQSDIFGSGMCVLDSREGRQPSIILDFGRELHGGLSLFFSSVSPAKTPQVRLRFGESVTETCSELNTVSLVETGSNEHMDLKNNTATNDHAMRDMVLTVPYYGGIEVGNTGYRFVRIDLLTPDMQVNFKEVSAIFRYRNIPYVGSFKCDDERLNEIWQTGAYTVHLNMQDYVWDGIKRDRLIWIGDLHPEAMTIAHVFGGDESVYATLDLACKQYPLPDNWFNGMSAYSMWYLIIQHDWYMHNGDWAFLQKHGDYIKGLIDQIDERIAEDGTENLGGGRFLDWPSSSNEAGVEAGYRALLIWSMQDAAKLCRILGDESQALKCEDIIRRLNKKVLPHNDLKQAAALMAIAGTMDVREACQDNLLVGGPKGFSTFYGYYMLQALAKGGYYEEAMDIISQFWGGMLDLGATTFWEDFNLEWTENVGRIDEFVPEGKMDIHGDFGAYCYPGFRHSFCHGWASGPTAWMSEHVLGIKVLEAGCKKIQITPHLGKLQWAEGTFPTPHGILKVRHEKQPDGTVKTTFKAPKGVKVVKQ